MKFGVTRVGAQFRFVGLELTSLWETKQFQLFYRAVSVDVYISPLLG